MCSLKSPDPQGRAGSIPASGIIIAVYLYVYVLIC